jgi:hypothetical protein
MFFAWKPPRDSFLRLAIGFTLAGVVTLALASSAEASRIDGACKPKAKARSAAKQQAKSPARTEAKAKAEAAIAAGKVAVFEFKGEETASFQSRVVKALRSKGMEVLSHLKAPDTPEQFREMSVALKLAVYVHGQIKDHSPSRSTATVMIRSGVSGRKVTEFSLTSDRVSLEHELGEVFWDRVENAIARACLDAEKPGRRFKATRINAGTPIEDSKPFARSGS